MAILMSAHYNMITLMFFAVISLIAKNGIDLRVIVRGKSRVYQS
jgi:hypothetical protein